MEDKYKGWIDGFGHIVSDQLGSDTRDKILNQCQSCQTITNDKEMGLCIKEVMSTFDQVVIDQDRRRHVMETMGNYCYKNFFAKTAEDVKKMSKGIEETVQNLNKFVGGEYFKLGENKIYSTLNQCFCQIGVKEVEEPISITYCNCSLGWMKSLFQTLLDRSVDVEILESIVSGGNACRFVINLD